MLQYLASSAQPPRRKKSLRLLGLVLVPFLLVASIAITMAGGGAASAAAACQAIDNNTAGGSTPVTGPVGAVGALTPLQVERYWVGAGGPLSAAVTAAAIASVESGDITDRLQGSSPSAPTVATAATPTDPSYIGWGLWQITPGSAADYNPAVNAKLAVGKYEGSLAAGGGGWSPWTTYTSGAYVSGIPAAQAAYAQLTAQGGGGAAPAPTGHATGASANFVSAAPTSPGATGGSGSLDAAAATSYANSTAGKIVGFSVYDASGSQLASYHGSALNIGRSITKTLLLAAYLRTHSTIDAVARAHLTAMIEQSSNADANWVLAQVGAGAVAKVASDAGMTHFDLNTTSDPVYHMGLSRISADDMARFFSRIDQMMGSHSGFGMHLLANIAAGTPGHTGVFDATGASGTIYSKSGWEAGVFNQVARITVGGQTYNIAVLTNSSSFTVGEGLVKDLVQKLFSGQGGSGSPLIDTSGLSAAQQAQINTEAAAMQSSGASSQCPNVSVSGALPTVPGNVATIQPSSGLAAAPTGLPPAVGSVIDKLIAAGNQIHTLPYIWGGGHGVPLDQLQAGYDCSGSTSYILYKAGLLSGEALVSGDFDHWGQPGPGKYITIFSNATHVFIEVDGIVLDTVWLDHPMIAPTSPGSGPRWQRPSMIPLEQQYDGPFTEEHPAGF